jgi:hypothetical protein
VREAVADLWSFLGKAEHVCITTNPIVNAQGLAVMGRGCALEAATRWPEVRKVLAAQVAAWGNKPHVLGSSAPRRAVWIYPDCPMRLNQLIDLRLFEGGSAPVELPGEAPLARRRGPRTDRGERPPAEGRHRPVRASQGASSSRVQAAATAASTGSRSPRSSPGSSTTTASWWSRSSPQSSGHAQDHHRLQHRSDLLGVSSHSVVHRVEVQPHLHHAGGRDARQARHRVRRGRRPGRHVGPLQHGRQHAGARGRSGLRVRAVRR